MDNSRISRTLRRENIRSTVHMECKDSTETLWFYSLKGTLPRIPPVKQTSIFEISPLHPSDAGYYFCYGLSEKGYVIARTELRTYGK